MTDSGLSLGPLPLTIGIVGHIDILEEKRAEIEAKVEEVIRKEIVQKYPHTPLVFLSSLAEGADRLVVQVVQQKFADRSSFVFPLPLSVDEYKRDFEENRTFEEFDRLLNIPGARCIQMPLVPGNTAENIRDPNGIQRKLQYALVGVYVARQSQILIALWNGENAHEIGGTSYTVQFALSGEFQDRDLQATLERVPEPFQPRLNPLNPPETGPVLRISAPRKKSSFGHGEEIRLEKLYNKDFQGKAREAEEYYDRVCGLMDDFNKDSFLIQRSNVRIKLRLSEEHLLPEDDCASLSKDLKKMRENFSIADALAIYFQGRTYISLEVLCVLVFLAAAFLDISPHLILESAKSWPFALNGLLIACAGGVYLWAKHGKFQSKFQDYRALAEGMRVQFYWRLSGIINSAADHYLRKQMSELEWIPNAIRNWSVPEDVELKPQKEIVLRRWINDQINYFRDQAWQSRKNLLLFDIVAFVSFIGFSLVLIYLLLQGVSYKLGPEWLQKAGWIIAAVFAVSTVWQLIEEMLDYREEFHVLRQEAEGHDLRMTQYERLPGEIIMRIVLVVLAPCLVLGIVLYFLGTNNMLLVQTNEEKLIHGILVLFSLMLAVNGGLHHFYAHKMAWAEHTKQYKRMVLFFENARNRFERLGNSGILDLGREALAENGDWVLLHRERPLEVPRH
jgi:hypothetical protein